MCRNLFKYYIIYIQSMSLRNAKSISGLTQNERIFVAQPYDTQRSHYFRATSRKRSFYLKTGQNQFRRFGRQRDDQENEQRRQNIGGSEQYQQEPNGFG